MNYLDLLTWLAMHPFLSALALFVQFAVIMTIHHKAHNKYLHYAMAIWFLPQDFVVNAVLMTIIGMELPQEWTVTARLQRWKKLNDLTILGRWRHGFAWFMCRQINRYDMGHC